MDIGLRWQAATEPHSESRALAYGCLGNVHKTRGELDDAVAMYQQALVINEELGRKEGMANAYLNLGTVHNRLGELDEALAMYQQALVINVDLGRKEGMANTYFNLGNLHQQLGEPDDAQKVRVEAIRLFDESTSPNAAQVRVLLSQLD